MTFGGICRLDAQRLVIVVCNHDSESNWLKGDYPRNTAGLSLICKKQAPREDAGFFN